MLRIGIDIGGTFTDFIAWRRAGDGPERTVSIKVPSTPGNYAEGFIAGLDRILASLGPASGSFGEENVIIVHGTTISTNTVIERSGAPIALLTTAGFRDVLNIQRLRLRNPTNLFDQRAPALVPRELVFDIEERMLFDGTVRTPLDEAQVAAVARCAAAQGAKGFAVAFYHSYRNPAHERAARRIIHDALGDIDVSLSSEIWPQIGEYERSMVAVLNAFVMPRMKSYVSEIERYLAARLPKARLFMTRSNGGAMSIAEAQRFPVQTLLSGPASGVTAALALADRLDTEAQPTGPQPTGTQYITFDMGGTSTDVSLVRDGHPMVSTTAEVGDFPVSMPVTDIEAIGAGGGSIVWLDQGVLRVGPQSAGARPGPASFGHGGEQPTISDAYLLCGYLDPDNFLGGRLKLLPAAAEAAFRRLADRAGLKLRAAAEAALNVATSNMVARVLPYMARHGVDPEDVTLIVYGGAGGIHGPLLAQELGIRRVLVPPTPSVFCASGGLITRLVSDVVLTVHGLALDGAHLQRGFADLERQARDWLRSQVDPAEITDIAIVRSVEARYRGQSFQIQVPLPQAALAGDLGALSAAFHAEHERLYSHCNPSGDVEVLQLRVRIGGALAAPELRPALPPGDAAAARTGTRRIGLGGHEHEAAIFDRARLGRGARIAGPAIIEQADTTTLVPPGFAASVNAYGDIMLARS